MRIIHANTYSRRGGAAIASFGLHGSLRKENVDSKFVCAVANQCDDHEVYALSFGKRLLWRTAKTLDANFSRLFEHRDDWRAGVIGVNPDLMGFYPDIVHFHWIQNGYFSTAALTKAAYQIPVVWTLHDLWPLTDGGAYRNVGSKRGDALGKAMRHALNPFWVAPSDFVASLAAKFGAATERIRVIPNGVDVDLFNIRESGEIRLQLGISERIPICLCSGVVESGVTAKGGDLLEELLERWPRSGKHADLVFIVLGEAQESIANLPHVRVLPRVSDRKRMAALYADSDLFVSVSRFESYGLMLVESQLSGTPVVAFDTAAIPEVVWGEETAFLAKPFDILSLIQKIDECVDRTKSDPSLARKCRIFAESKFSSSLIAKKHRLLYEELLEVNANGTSS